MATSIIDVVSALDAMMAAVVAAGPDGSIADALAAVSAAVEGSMRAERPAAPGARQGGETSPAGADGRSPYGAADSRRGCPPSSGLPSGPDGAAPAGETGERRSDLLASSSGSDTPSSEARRRPPPPLFDDTDMLPEGGADKAPKRRAGGPGPVQEAAAVGPSLGRRDAADGDEDELVEGDVEWRVRVAKRVAGFLDQPRPLPPDCPRLSVLGDDERTAGAEARRTEALSGAPSPAPSARRQSAVDAELPAASRAKTAEVASLVSPRRPVGADSSLVSLGALSGRARAAGASLTGPDPEGTPHAANNDTPAPSLTPPPRLPAAADCDGPAAASPPADETPGGAGRRSRSSAADLLLLTPLELAVALEAVGPARQLLQAGCDVDAVGGFPCTALCKVCYALPHNATLARLLLAAGANPDATTNNDMASASCLIISVVKGSQPIVKALLDYGADVGYAWRGASAMSMAMDFKQHAIVQLFETFQFRRARANRWERFQAQRAEAAAAGSGAVEAQGVEEGAGPQPPTPVSGAAAQHALPTWHQGGAGDAAAGEYADRQQQPLRGGAAGAAAALRLRNSTASASMTSASGVAPGDGDAGVAGPVGPPAAPRENGGLHSPPPQLSPAADLPRPPAAARRLRADVDGDVPPTPPEATPRDRPRPPGRYGPRRQTETGASQPPTSPRPQSDSAAPSGVPTRCSPADASPAALSSLAVPSPPQRSAASGSGRSPSSGAPAAPQAGRSPLPGCVSPASLDGVMPPALPPPVAASGAAPAAAEAEAEASLARVTRQLDALEWLVPSTDLVIEEHIASGAHGDVMRGRLESTGDAVAVKRFPCLDARSRDTFRREVEMLARFRHENVVLFRGAVVEPRHCLVMTELCACSLFDRLAAAVAAGGAAVAPAWSARLRWGRDIARAMTYLHTRRPPVVHRDLKSMNVLLDGSGVVKVCDFGIARFRESTFVATQHIAGSPAWMAPEVLRGEDFSEPSDVYAFGVILWELATCRVPWEGKTMPQLVGLVGFGKAQLTLPPDVAAGGGLPPALGQLMEQCLDHDPARRPAFRTVRETLDGIVRAASPP